MKIAASDYDGTLFRRGGVSREDLAAIRAWREEGNLFGLATGRDLNLIRIETENRHIPFDFVVCNTGAAVYEEGYHPLHLVHMPPEAATVIIDHPAARSSLYFLFSESGRTFIDLHSSEAWLTGLGLPLTPIDTDAARRLTDLQQIGLEFTSAELARAVSEALNRDLGRSMYAQQSGACVDIVPGGASKAEGLAMLLKLKGWGPEIVLAVGDSENDLSMVQRFHGYAMASAPESLKAAARGVVDSPADMLWAHM